MRYVDFKIVETRLREASEVYVIGDSHAKAMGGTNNLASNGAKLDAIATQASRVPNGATVYMTGGHNDVPAGTSPQQIANQVKSIISSLEGKGCTVNYILFPEGSSNTNQDQMAATRQAIKSATSVTNDLDGCSMQGDGIHCSLGSYRGIVGASADANTDANAVVAQELAAGPPYPAEDSEEVKQMQTNLDKIGYTVGSTGVDGKYGPRTTAAVRAFKKDYPVDGNGLSIDADGLETLSKVAAGAIPQVEEPTATGNESGGSIGDLGDLASLENIGQAKEVVEDFLGSTVDDEELNMLIRATAAEASPNSQERGAVAAVILNRVRSNRYPNSIESVLKQGGQFQAVTGTRTGPRDSQGNRTWTGPHSNFSNMSDRTGAQIIGALIRYLPDTDKSWLNFTANSAAAYGAGTNIGFMHTMRQAQGSQVIGGTVFGTA